MEPATNFRPLIAAGLMLGMGLGGFVDGIVLHQILQWHGMVTHFYPKTGLSPEVIIRNYQINMFWDGVFHAFTWAVTVAGVALLWRAGARADVPWSGRAFLGSVLLGWGIFNLVEGIVDHHLLQVHHVTEDANHVAWDLGFLGFSALLIVGGLLILRSATRDPQVPARVGRRQAPVTG